VRTRIASILLLLAAAMASAVPPSTPSTPPRTPAPQLPSSRSILLDDAKVQSITADLVEYESQPGLAGTMRCRGGDLSTILVSVIVNEFSRIYPSVHCDVMGGGSTRSVDLLMNGQTDLITIGRPLTEQETAGLRAKVGVAPIQIPIAIEAIGVFVNRSNPIESLTLDQLRAIYTRTPPEGSRVPETWGDLGITGPLADKLIERHALSNAHTTHMYFRNNVLNGDEYRFAVRFDRVPGILMDAVAAKPEAIGFATAMFASEGTRLVPIVGPDGRAYLPGYEEAVRNLYPIPRRVHTLVICPPPGKPPPVAAIEFMRFAVSRRGQRMIGYAGSYPITAEMQQQAIQQLGAAPR
jgi:phosphate transport system substrate-binding protein